MQAMKTNRIQSRFSNHRILTGLLALGILLAAFVGYTGGRTSAADAPGERISSHPSGNVIEAWVRRIDGPIHGSDHAHDLPERDLDGVGVGKFCGAQVSQRQRDPSTKLRAGWGTRAKQKCIDASLRVLRRAKDSLG